MNTKVFTLLLKHRRLDDAIRAEQRFHWPDAMRIQRLKKLKLATRDRLHALTLRRKVARAG